jgi:hypothetical protein
MHDRKNIKYECTFLQPATVHIQESLLNIWIQIQFSADYQKTCVYNP